jgi:hypothetical protein
MIPSLCYMILPLCPQQPPAVSKYIWLAILLVCGAISWVPFLFLTVVNKNIDLFDAVVPFVIAWGNTVLMVLMLSGICKVASAGLYSALSASVTVVFTITSVLLDYLEYTEGDVVQIITMKILPIATADAICLWLTLWLTTGLFTPVSGMHILFAGSVAGVLLGSFWGLLNTLSKFDIPGFDADETFMFLAWADSWFVMTLFGIIGAIGSVLAAAQRIGLNRDSAFCCLMSFLVPFGLIFLHQSASEIRKSNPGTWLVHAPVLGYLIATAVLIVLLRSLIRRNSARNKYLRLETD